MKFVLLFLICALLFEFSTQIKNNRAYVQRIPKLPERGCRVQNGTLICLKPKISNSTIIKKPIMPKLKNHTKCSVEYRLVCSKIASGETYCNCMRKFPIIKRTKECPKGTILKCTRIRRGCIIFNDCSCQVEDKITPISNKTKIKKINSYGINNN